MATLITRDETVHGVNYYLASDFDSELCKAQAKANLYEKLRKLNPRQFAELHALNLAGKSSFDDLVHQLEN